MCQDYFGVALKSYFTPFASRGTAQKAKGGVGGAFTFDSHQQFVSQSAVSCVVDRGSKVLFFAQTTILP